MDKCKEFILMKKSVQLSTPPCGTPVSWTNVWERAVPTRTRNVRFDSSQTRGLGLHIAHKSGDHDRFWSHGHTSGIGSNDEGLQRWRPPTTEPNEGTLQVCGC
ncbi:uncharacterized protein LOC142776190 [Rhipicephalus microplus]|uniref:uncharacterized protein LOC142776190 n=1 Tax=Rhipicephalus microplus TaxID=6941 RepID=UPI003F6B1292